MYGCSAEAPSHKHTHRIPQPTMTQTVRLAVVQARSLSTTSETLVALASIADDASAKGISLLLFPEAFIGGYPRSCSFGVSVGSRSAAGTEQFLAHFKSAVDLGDTPQDADQDWVDRKLPRPRDGGHRGDGTREELEQIARESGVFIVTGLTERAGGSLYCAVVYVCPQNGIVGKRRKVMPTGAERLVWAQGSARSLQAVTTSLNGVKVTLAAAICWENYMPLLRHSLYAQNVNLYLAPTADARDTWLSLMRTIGCESRAFVLSSNQSVREKHLPDWIRQGNAGARKPGAAPTTGDEAISMDLDRALPEMPSLIRPKKARSKSIITETPERHQICWPVVHRADEVEDEHAAPTAPEPETSQEDAFVCRGGSCVISPSGSVLAGPLWETDRPELLIVDVDFDDCERGRLEFDAAGSYSRNDAFHLTVDGLDLNPPP